MASNKISDQIKGRPRSSRRRGKINLNLVPAVTRRAVICFLAIFVGLLGHGMTSTQYAHAEITLTDVRLGLNETGTRFVLETDSAVPYQLFTLTAPDRVVIDLPALEWQGPEGQDLKAGGLVSGFRHGLYRPGIVRVVLDLAKSAQIAKHFILGPSGTAGHRIVIDLSPASETKRLDTPIQTAGWADYQQRLAASGQASTAAAPPASSTGVDKPVVVIDPGHGGVDPGAIGVTGTYEKHIVLTFAKKLRETLEQTGRYHVVLTRDRDIFIPLRDRYAVAHRVEGDLFISVHADSHNNSQVRGFSVYTLSDKASDREAAQLAARENKSDLLAGTDLTQYEEDVSSILISLAQQSVMQDGSTFAEMVVSEMRSQVRLLRNPHRFAGFAVLKSPNVPSVLVELGFLSTPAEEQLLQQREHLGKVSTGMLRAIDRFFEERQRLERS